MKKIIIILTFFSNFGFSQCYELPDSISWTGTAKDSVFSLWNEIDNKINPEEWGHESGIPAISINYVRLIELYRKQNNIEQNKEVLLFTTDSVLFTDYTLESIFDGFGFKQTFIKKNNTCDFFNYFQFSKQESKQPLINNFNLLFIISE
ncbi:MAG: hypothetical protein CMP67_01960 [Flavobacteriales bacterium]|nr:hypothetical protein [Flavobacteriales bacterium]|tara:strand:+ start:1049 stop:1495 length:447 start_codon:yes stop_codon:yes gene_type:complete